GRTPIILSDRRLNDPITLQTVGPSGDYGDPVTVLPSAFADRGRCLHADIVPTFEDAATLQHPPGHATRYQDDAKNDDDAYDVDRAAVANDDQPKASLQNGANDADPTPDDEEAP